MVELGTLDIWVESKVTLEILQVLEGESEEE